MNYLAYVIAALIAIIIAMGVGIWRLNKRPAIYYGGDYNGYGEKARDWLMKQLVAPCLNRMKLILSSWEEAAMVLIWPLIIFSILRFVLGYNLSVRTVIEILKNPWDKVNYELALATSGILLLLFFKGFEIDDRIRMIMRRMTVIILIAMLVLPWLSHFVPLALEGVRLPAIANTASSAPQIEKSAPIQLAPVAPPASPPNAPLSKHQPGFSGVENDGDRTTVWVNGTEEKGVQAAMLKPGEKYAVCWKEGYVNTYNTFTKKNDVMPLWGINDGYIYKQPVDVDWSPTFRYSAVKGIMPHATLVILGEIGPGNETVLAFPKEQYCLTAQNITSAPQPLMLYYHGMAYYWLSQKDGVYFPSQALAASMGGPAVVWTNGWKDQGKTSEIFTVKRLP